MAVGGEKKSVAHEAIGESQRKRNEDAEKAAIVANEASDGGESVIKKKSGEVENETHKGGARKTEKPKREITKRGAVMPSKKCACEKDHGGK